MRALSCLLVFWVGCAHSEIAQEALQHNQFGAEQFREGELDDAEANFRLALEYNSHYAEPRANLGLVYLARGDLKNAESNLQAAIEINEDFALAWANLGFVFEKRGNDAKALEAYEKSLSIDPGIREARGNLARILIKQHQLVPARAHLLRLVQVVPRDVQAQSLLAYCELRLHRRRAARMRAEKALELNPNEPTALIVRATVKAEQGDLEGAEADLQRAAKDPDTAAQARVRLAAISQLRHDSPQLETESASTAELSFVGR